ncbi:bifunctional [glutamine synthetase] adenylyltransferase/[glutamine synthetase]-adenylyl-L-tyrosine phosphorylase [Nostocoides vanveenii]|uniref:Bifunctional glutamine synthetase adenylyltransferase/adenylyl-removing enzyme n=2 Tax=Nostocoides vanveenii TaxID=330835 RepID=A0ABP4WVD6_9MICO
MAAARTESAGAMFARLGFADPARAERLVADSALTGLIDPLDDDFADGVIQALADVADPDLALLTLVRLMESLRTKIASSPDDPALGRELPALIATLRHPGPGRERILAVLGASMALGDHLIAHPEHWRSVAEARTRTVEERVERLVSKVSLPPEGLTPEDALRVYYRRGLLGIAALDLVAPDPLVQLPTTAAALADLAQAALEAALALARAELPEEAEQCRLAVIAMGKAGGRELNYISDVDVIFVAEPAGGADEPAAMAAATKVATRLMTACSASTSHGTLWSVDAALRPEGKHGPLVRTVASHQAYYERWAKTWEFQALLKARVVAGDREVGEDYLATMMPMVWQAASRENFVDEVQAMRRRVEAHIPSAEAGRQLKLGPGGLRDIEFSVQLLQLVHGRTDPSLRSGTTLDGLAALAAGGYVGRDDAAVLGSAYRLLRTLEHRIQLLRLRRTHLMPTSQSELRRLGRALGHRQDAATTLLAQWKAESREVRRLHERLFYRPLLNAVARLDSDEARLTPEAARERLQALGFRDPKGALRHIEALTEGLSRRAAIQRHLLPVMLGWFAQEIDPDGGLLAFRDVSESLGTTHWYLRLLRDEPQAAEYLARTLARSRFAADVLRSAPEGVQILGDAGGLVPRSRADIERRMRVAASIKKTPEQAVKAARQIRKVELFRVAVADLMTGLGSSAVGVALADITEATIEVALEAVSRATEARTGQSLLTKILIMGMGRLGGRECGYASDADVIYVHDPLVGVDQGAAQAQALEIVKDLVRVLGEPGPDPAIGLDADLRPEGKNGPLIRSLDSYRSYYDRWAVTWEAQALIRARPVAGDNDLAAEFLDLIDPIRWPDSGLDQAQVREIRRLKARMEAERLPRGADRRTHFKLGTGGLSDVEWTTQLLQLEHAHTYPTLRTTSTLPALQALAQARLISSADHATLSEAWQLAARARDAAMLYRGRPVDQIPSDAREADGTARIMGLAPGSGQELAENYRRVGRHARAVVDRLFYGETEDGPFGGHA